MITYKTHENIVDPIRPREILAAHPKLRKYSLIYHGEYGPFFDTLETKDLSLGYSLSSNLSYADGRSYHLKHDPVFPRLENFFRKYDKGWNDTFVHMTNYMRIISEIVSDFAIGDELNISFVGATDEQVNTWEAFRDMSRFDEVTRQVLQETVAVGYSGAQVKVKNDLPYFDYVRFQSYFPEKAGVFGYDMENIYLHYYIELIEEEFPEDGDVKIKTSSKAEYYEYMVSYQKEGDNVVGQHVVYEAAAPGQLRINARSVRRNDILEAYIMPENQLIAADGSEDVLTRNVPVNMMNTPRRDKTGTFGQSIMKDSMSYLQDLAVLHTITSNEIQKHHKSMVAIPQSAVMQRKDGTAKLKSQDFFILEMESQIPKYIQKDVSFFEPMFKQRDILLEEISKDTHIPFEILKNAGATGNEKVELAKIRNKPFEVMIKSFQKELDTWIRRAIQDFFYTMGMEPPENIIISFPDVFQADRSERVAEMSLKLDSGLVSRKRAIMDLEGYDEDMAEQIIAEADADARNGLGEINFEEQIFNINPNEQ